MDRRTFLAASIKGGILAGFAPVTALLPACPDANHTFEHFFGQGISLELDGLWAIGAVVGESDDPTGTLTRAERERPVLLQQAAIRNYENALRCKPGDREATEWLACALKKLSAYRKYTS